jgi:hypothetical protein
VYSGLIRWCRVKDGVTVLCVGARVAAGLCCVYLCRVGADSRNTLSHGDHTSPIQRLWFTRAHSRGCTFTRLYSGDCIQAVVFTRLTCADARHVPTHGDLTSLARHTPQPYSTKMSPVLCPPQNAPTHGDHAVDVCRCTTCAYAWRSYFSRTPYSTAILHKNVSCPLSSTKCAYAW